MFNTIIFTRFIVNICKHVEKCLILQKSERLSKEPGKYRIDEESEKKHTIPFVGFELDLLRKSRFYQKSGKFNHKEKSEERS